MSTLPSLFPNRTISCFSMLVLLTLSGAGRGALLAAADVAEIATIQSLAAKGVTVATSTDPKDDSLIDVTITVKRASARSAATGPQIDTVGYAIYDRPIDETFCQRTDHSGIPLLEQKQSRENTVRFSFRATAVKNGYIMAKFVLRDPANPRSEFDYIKLENVVSPP